MNLAVGFLTLSIILIGFSAFTLIIASIFFRKEELLREEKERLRMLYRTTVASLLFTIFIYLLSVIGDVFPRFMLSTVLNYAWIGMLVLSSVLMLCFSIELVITILRVRRRRQLEEAFNIYFPRKRENDN